MSMPKCGSRSLDTHYPFKHGKPSTAKEVTATLETNVVYLERIYKTKAKEITNSNKQYVRKGLINPTNRALQRVDKYRNQAIDYWSNAYNKIK